MLKWLSGWNRIQVGAEARKLMDNPVLAAAFSNIEERLQGEWKETRLPAVEDRERLYTMLQMLRQVKTELHRAILEGDMETRRQARENE